MYRNKYKSFIILNDKKEILKYDSSHNHPEKEYDMELKKFNSLWEYNDDIFVDGTFFIAPKFSYQIFITRTYAKELDTNEISVLIERYKNIETKLIDTKCDKNNTINLWFDCLTDLNNII
ncbi:hypothetical protein H8356DRAFT_1432575 [Neocallimastix lanati (nom. inval.)]|nr:hypothetical protein H8356DRAFT_1432575 [Neocallimastix sp. JGI-2020a]